MTKWYVYALFEDVQSTADPVANAIYVGKGCGDRKDAHKREVLKGIDRQLKSGDSGGSNPQKLKRIRDLIAKGKPVPAVRMGGAYMNEEDAYAAENLLIATINRHRAAVGTAPLLNAVGGHSDDGDGDGLIDMNEMFSFIETKKLVLPKRGGNRSGILVKASNTAGYATPRKASNPTFVYNGQPVGHIQRYVYGKKRNDRDVWDPHKPWPNSVAIRRAARFWAFSEDDVVSWVNGDADRPTVCALAVNFGGQTTIRYVWEIDYGGCWQRFPTQWGIPLGERLSTYDTTLIGKALYEKTDEGQLRQALFARPKGCRTFRYKETGTIGAQ